MKIVLKYTLLFCFNTVTIAPRKTNIAILPKYNTLNVYFLYNIIWLKDVKFI